MLGASWMPDDHLLPCTQLINYPTYRKHELRALHDWLRVSRRVLSVIGVFGPLDSRADAMELYPTGDLGAFRQSPAFVVL